MRKLLAVLLMAALTLGLVSCSGGGASESGEGESVTEETESASGREAGEEEEASYEYISDKEYIEEVLNLKNNENQEWTYYGESDAWVLSVVPAVAYPETEDQQGVSVCVPGAYVKGVDTNGDGNGDITGETYTGPVKGSLVIDYEAKVVSTNGQEYTAGTAPVIINTGAAGYGSSTNTPAAVTYAGEGYINVSCGNRGKQDTAVDENGGTYYTGDAPCCLTDQKNAARFIRYNILLGNIPGSIEYFVSTGGSGGGAHAVMFAATGDNPDFYDYQEKAGAVGVYRLSDGGFSTSVTIEGSEYEISDGAWGCMAYSPITSLAEADMAMAFEYYLDADYEFGSSFQKALAGYLSESYMEYINAQELEISEELAGFDLNNDGDTADTISLRIERDLEKYPETNGYYGTYLDLYLAEFTENLQWYLDNLDYAEGWTWFGTDGNVLTDEETAALTAEEKAAAFIEGRYTAAGSSGLPSGIMGNLGGIPDDVRAEGEDLGGAGNLEGGRGMNGGKGGGMPGGGEGGKGPENAPEGDDAAPGNETGFTAEKMNAEGNGGMPGEAGDGNVQGMKEGGLKGGSQGGTDGNGEELRGGGAPDMENGQAASIDNSMVAENSLGDSMVVGTPDAGTTQAAGSSLDSSNYESFADMLKEYEEDIAGLEAGDEFGNNIVELYNPLNYIGAGGTSDPVWVRMLMGASEGDMSMFSSLNLRIAMLNAGIDAELEWQWNGKHVPSEIFSESFALYVDQMYGEHVNGKEITGSEAAGLTANGSSEKAEGTDISSWVDYTGLDSVSFTLAAAAAYRTAGASKTTPGFDVIDYGQEDYVFGNSEKDARHWDRYLLDVFNKYSDELSSLFNQGE